MVALFLNILSCLEVRAEPLKLQALSQDPQWLALGHYQPDGESSYIDSKKFFLNKAQGKKNSKAELETTIKIFQQEIIDGKYSTICSYPARFIFLSNSYSEFDVEILANCPEYQEWKSLIAAKGVSLIFPTSFINNPASAFGHTFLRLDQDPDNKETDLYSYSINFSAETGGEPGLIYAFLGVFGGYDGFFTVAPYYKLLKVYADLERRDIWEYRLDFTESEIELLVAHLWELREVNFTYYYFDENCSYQLLGLLDVLRPSLGLRNKFNNWVLPVDTLKAIVEQGDLLIEEIYRPSISEELFNKLKNYSSEEVTLIKNIIDSHDLVKLEAQLKNHPRRIELFDLAYDYLNYLVVADEIPKETSDDLALGILKARSLLPDQEFLRKDVNYTATSPLLGHDSAYLSLGSGVDDKNFYTQLNFRGVYHNLLDPQEGFTKGMGLVFMNLAVRWINNRLLLEELRLVELASLTPVNDLISPLSWRLQTGFLREETKFDSSTLVSVNRLSFGKAYNLTPEIYTFGLLGGNLKLNTHLESNNASGLGANLGVVANFGDLRVKLESYLDHYWWGSSHSAANHSVSASYSLNERVLLNIDFARLKEFKDYQNKYSLSLGYFF